MLKRISFLVAILTITTIVAAQSSSALLNEALDRIYPLDLNTSLPVAMKAIGEQTGVRIEASSAVWNLLPWGDQTKITAKIEGKTLRDALDIIARTLGLQVVQREEVVQLQPMPALTRLGRRSTVQELNALNQLASTPADLKSERVSVAQLIEAVNAKLNAIKSNVALDNHAGDAAAPDAQLFIPHNASLMDALEALPKATRATWYPWGKTILIVPKEEQIRSLLEKSITLRYNGVDIQQVLAELSQRAGVEFTFEPGSVQRIPVEFRTIRLVLDNATIRQALENIASFTGLGYVVNDNGVYLWNQQNDAAGSSRDPIVGQLPLDNGMTLFVRKSQLPDDLQQYIKFKTDREFAKVRQQMKEEGFTPTSKPTTKPDNDL